MAGVKLSLSNSYESLEQANSWLSKRLQLTEDQVREGEEVNLNLTEENRLLKEKKLELLLRIEELTSELDQLRIDVSTNNEDKEVLRKMVKNLEGLLSDYKSEEEFARINSEELKCEMEKAQEVMVSYTSEINEMRSYIAQLEDKSDSLVVTLETSKHENSMLLQLKEKEIFDLRRTISDMESANGCRPETGESGDFICKASQYGSGSSPLCRSSPAVVAKQMPEESVEIIQDLERRLESVQVANEIYQDEMRELKNKLNDYSGTKCERCANQKGMVSESVQTESRLDSSIVMLGAELQTENEPQLITDVLSKCNDEEQLADYFDTLSIQMILKDCSTQTDDELPIAPAKADLVRCSTQTDKHASLSASSQTNVNATVDSDTQCDSLVKICATCGFSQISGNGDKKKIPPYSDAVVECNIMSAEIALSRSLRTCFMQTEPAYLTDAETQCEVVKKTNLDTNMEFADMIKDLKDSIEERRSYRQFVGDAYNIFIIALIVLCALIWIMSIISTGGFEARRVLQNLGGRPSSIPPH